MRMTSSSPQTTITSLPRPSANGPSSTPTAGTVAISSIWMWSSRFWPSWKESSHDQQDVQGHGGGLCAAGEYRCPGAGSDPRIPGPAGGADHRLRGQQPPVRAFQPQGAEDP